MSKKVSKKKKDPVKKTEKKKAEKKPVEKKKPVKQTEEKQKTVKPFVARLTFAADLVLGQKTTDENIIDAVNEKFSDYSGKKFNQKEMGRVRWMLRNGKLPTRTLKEGQKFDRLFFDPEKNCLVSREDRPKKKRASKKIQKKDDPLNNVAGINVHDEKPKKEKSEEAPKKEPVKEEPKPNASKKKQKKKLSKAEILKNIKDKKKKK